jgi:trehalose 6-phosphate phosphatase
MYIQPKNFADYLSNQQAYCLFLDIDGTLADFTLNPKDSVIPKSTLMLLQKIQSHDVKIVIVTGRSLAEARQMLSPIQLPIAATHGLEIAFDGVKHKDSNNENTSVAQVNTIELAAIRQAIIQSCLPYDDFTIEDKPYSVALHYRQNPALADVAYTIMSKTLKNCSNWILQQGKYVWELVPKGVNKGTAILTLLKKMQTTDNLCSIFIGDDITDEAGFMVVQGDSRLIENNSLIEKHQKPVAGIGIKVGSEPTCAHYYVHDIHEVTLLLDNFLTFCQKRAALVSNLADTDPSLPKKTMRHTI